MINYSVHDIAQIYSHIFVKEKYSEHHRAEVLEVNNALDEQL